MFKHTQSKKAPLPFPQWMEKTYPKKTRARKLLRMIGALDLAYLMYRIKSQTQPSAAAKTKTIRKKKPVNAIPMMPLKIEDYVEIVKQVKQPTKPATPKKKIEKKQELTIEFEQTLEPAARKTHQPHPPTDAATIEPEPLVLQEEPRSDAITAAIPGRSKHAMWFNNEHLEDADLRKTHHKLETHGISVAFETLYGDEEETVIVVNGVSWRILLTSPALNLGKMAQIIRATYGELYVLGRMALGAMSGEGYVSADEATRVAETLAVTQSKTIDIDVRYHDKDGTSKTRVAHTIRIRFERV